MVSVRLDTVSTLAGHRAAFPSTLPPSPVPESISLPRQLLLPCAKPCVRQRPMYDMTYELPRLLAQSALTEQHTLTLVQFCKSAAGYRVQVKGSAGQAPLGGSRETWFLPFSPSRDHLDPLACGPFLSL